MKKYHELSADLELPVNPNQMLEDCNQFENILAKQYGESGKDLLALPDMWILLNHKHLLINSLTGNKLIFDLHKIRDHLGVDYVSQMS